jgi:hypothetical protein
MLKIPNPFKAKTHHTAMPVPILSHSSLVYKAIFKTLLGIFNPKLWFLSLVPLLIAGTVWALIGAVFWDVLTQSLRNTLSGLNTPTWFPVWLPDRMVWISLLVLLFSLPLVSITALALVNVWGTPTLAKRIAKRYHLDAIEYTPLERTTQLIATLWHSAWVLTVLAVLWLLSLPTWLIMGLGLVLQLLLLAWANVRLFSRDVLLDVAHKAERDSLLKKHRTSLLALGLIASLPSLLPSALWLGGAMMVLFLPAMALLGVWLSIMVSLSASLLFSHYLFPALQHLRLEQSNLTASLEAHAHANAVTLEGGIKEISEGAHEVVALPFVASAFETLHATDTAAKANLNTPYIDTKSPSDNEQLVTPF